MKKEYVVVWTISENMDEHTDLGAIGWYNWYNVANGEPQPFVADEAIARAKDAALAVFKAPGESPGRLPKRALVRTDGGRAVVCQTRGRAGW